MVEHLSQLLKSNDVQHGWWCSFATTAFGDWDGGFSHVSEIEDGQVQFRLAFDLSKGSPPQGLQQSLLLRRMLFNLVPLSALLSMVLCPWKGVRALLVLSTRCSDVLRVIFCVDGVDCIASEQDAGRMIPRCALLLLWPQLLLPRKRRLMWHQTFCSVVSPS